MPRKERPKKIYEIVNIHPEYASDEEKEEKLKGLKRDLILIWNRWE